MIEFYLFVFVGSKTVAHILLYELTSP